MSHLPADSVDGITLALARLGIETPADEIPESAYAAGRMALLDALGCAFVGHDAPGVQTVFDLSAHWGGREEATVWFHSCRLPSPETAFVNSVQLHALDDDDYHPPSDSHITSVLVPAVLAAAEVADASERETLAALILGTEVVGRLGRATKARRRHIGFLPTSVIGGFGATAAACRLQGCSVAETVDAMGIWFAHASGNRQALFDRTLTKRIQPGIAARAALFASSLAARGFGGPHRIIAEQPASLCELFGFDRGDATPTVGEVMAPRPTWTIEELHYKRFACCGVSGPAVTAAIALSKEHGLSPEMVESIRVFGPCVTSPFGAVGWGDHPTPQVLAQFCVPYAVACAIRHRAFGPAEIIPERIAEDIAVDSLARRTQLCDWSDWTGAEPEKGQTALLVTLKDGRELRTTQSEHRRFQSPHDDDALIAKFRSNVRLSGRLGEADADRCVSALQSFGGERCVQDFIRQWLG
jgi:2-methylcitrate dehydratase PrpD